MIKGVILNIHWLYSAGWSHSTLAPAFDYIRVMCVCVCVCVSATGRVCEEVGDILIYSDGLEGGGGSY